MPLSNRQKFHESLKQKRKRIASQQISRALKIAINPKNTHSIIGERSSALAWKLSTKFNVRLKEKRLLFCHKCKAFIVPPGDARYRLSKKRSKTLTITCLKCGYVYRKPF
ncbi:MAG: RNase P subunit [Thaumarchaeota archaeon]|nr:RNase P subunit [Nitrososphaerota archaeon]